MGLLVNFQIIQLFRSCKVRQSICSLSYVLILFYDRRFFPHLEFSGSSIQNFCLRQNIQISFSLFSHFRWRRGRIAQVLCVPITAVYIHFNYYNRSVRKNYVTVNFFDNQSLQVKEII